MSGVPGGRDRLQQALLDLSRGVRRRESVRMESYRTDQASSRVVDEGAGRRPSPPGTIIPRATQDNGGPRGQEAASASIPSGAVNGAFAAQLPEIAGRLARIEEALSGLGRRPEPSAESRELHPDWVRRLGGIEEGLAALRNMPKPAPASSELRAELAHRLGRIEEGLAALRNMPKPAPASPDLPAELAQRLGRIEEGLAALRNMPKPAPASRELPAELAQRLGRIEEGLAAVKSLASAPKPDFPMETLAEWNQRGRDALRVLDQRLGGVEACLVALNEGARGVASAGAVAECGKRLSQIEEGLGDLKASGRAPVDLSADWAQRLDRIDEALAELRSPADPEPASREVFAAWVRLRQSEDVPFAEFLRLRRARAI